MPRSPYIDDMPRIPPMGPDEFRQALAELGFIRVDHPNHSGIAPAAQWLGIGERTAHRMGAGQTEIPGAVAALLRLMRKYRLSPEGVAKLD